jgi:radical SAM protein with 4Fe4S-binding SPASM domain
MNKPEKALAGRLHQLEENRRLNLAEQYAQLETLESKPLHVAVPTGNRCNLRCIFCTDRSSSSPTKYTDLTFDQFLKFTEPLDGALLTQLYGWGEPLVNPDYERMFDYVAEHFPGTRIYISTNGVLLTDKWVDKLLTYGKCLVNVSLNAATPETYAQVTQNNLFPRVVDNVRHLMQAKEDRGINDLVVTFSFVAIKPNIHELPHFIELSDELGIRYVTLQDLNILEESHAQLFLGEEEEEARQVFLAAAEIARARGVYLDSFTHYPVTYFVQDRSEAIPIALPRDCLSVWEQDNTPFYPQPGECYEPWMTFLLSLNGEVTTCCRAREIMGNLLEQSFEEIWNGEVYRTYRRTINTFRPPEACTTCPVKTGLDIR